MVDVVPNAGVIALGKQGENQAVRVTLPNIRAGAGSILLLHQRAADQQPYPVPVVEADGGIIWTVSSTDTAYPGRGQAELQWLGTDGAVIKSVTYQTNTLRALTAPGAVPDEPLRPYTQAVARDAQAAKNAAARATEAARRAEASAGQAGLSAENAANTLKKLEDGITSGDFQGKDGKSAYQLAVDAGFDGTEPQWLESLKGAPGDTTAADAAAAAAQKSAEAAQKNATAAKAAAQEAQKAAEASAASAAQAVESVGRLADDLAMLKTENTALKAEAARTARSLDYLWKKSRGIIYDTETVTGAGSSVTVPSGAMEYAVLRKLGGMSQRDADNNVLIDAPVDEVRVASAAGDSTNTCPIPQAIRDLCPDYGIGTSADCYNYIDFAARQYHHRVGQVDLGTLDWYDGRTATSARRMTTRRPPDNVKIPQSSSVASNTVCPTYESVSPDDTWLCVKEGIAINTGNGAVLVYDSAFAAAEFLAAFKTHITGVSLYYELAIPETIDLSAVWPDDDFGVLRVEAGGTINLHYPALDDSYELAVPSETEIMVDVAKVVGTDG